MYGVEGILRILSGNNLVRWDPAGGLHARVAGDDANGMVIACENWNKTDI